MTDGGDNGTLPAGWKQVRLGDVLELRNGRAFKPSEWVGAGRPIIRIQNLKSKTASFNRYDGDLPDRFAARPGDLLFAWSGTPGTSFGAHVWDGPLAWINQHIFRVDFSADDFDRDFLKCALNVNLTSYIEQAQGGVGLAHITKAKLNESLLIVPPLPEQRRIARRLRETEAHRKSALTHLRVARTVLDRLRGAVLAAACSGRLTPDWRELHLDTVDSLVRDLQSQVAARKRSVAEPDRERLPEIPSSWRAVSLGLLIDRIEAGKSVRAEGRRAEQHEWGVIKVSAMSWGQFRAAENKAITDPGLINTRYEVRPGDLLLSRANTVDLVGATVLVTETRPRLLLSDKSLRLVPLEGIDKAWLNLALRSPFARAQFAERATGTSESMRNLSQPKILATTLALPPADEQREVVRRVTAAFASLDRLAVGIEQASGRLDRLSRAAQAKAFRGELVASGDARTEEVGEPTDRPEDG